MKIVDKSKINEVTKAVLNGEVVAFPTETVYGLAVVYDDERAFNRLVDVKKRRPDKPFSMMLSDIKEMDQYCVLSQRGRRIVNEFMPGEITVLVDAKPLPTWVTLGTNVIGIRIPDDDYVRELIRVCKKPLLVTSANMSGEKPLTHSKDVEQVFKNEDVSYLVLGECKSETPSTVVDIRNDIKVVRIGKISETRILNCLK